MQLCAKIINGWGGGEAISPFAYNGGGVPETHNSRRGSTMGGQDVDLRFRWRFRRIPWGARVWNSRYMAKTAGIAGISRAGNAFASCHRIKHKEWAIPPTNGRRHRPTQRNDTHRQVDNAKLANRLSKEKHILEGRKPGIGNLGGWLRAIERRELESTPPTMSSYTAESPNARMADGSGLGTPIGGGK